MICATLTNLIPWTLDLIFAIFLSHIRGKPLVGESLLLLGPNARSALISVGISLWLEQIS